MHSTDLVATTPVPGDADDNGDVTPVPDGGRRIPVAMRAGVPVVFVSPDLTKNRLYQRRMKRRRQRLLQQRQQQPAAVAAH